MRFCWVGPRAISLLTIVLQCLDKWILVICNYWLDEACSKYFDLIGESETMVCPPKYCKLLIDYLERWGFAEWDREQWLNRKLVHQHLDKWTIMICDCWLFCERYAQKIFSWVTKVKQRMQLQVLLWLLYLIFRESASQRVWLGPESMTTQISWFEKFNNMFREPPLLISFHVFHTLTSAGSYPTQMLAYNIQLCLAIFNHVGQYITLSSQWR